MMDSDAHSMRPLAGSKTLRWISALMIAVFLCTLSETVEGAVRQVASAQTPDASCTVAADGSSAVCDPLPQSLTVTFSPTLAGSKLVLLPEWSTLSWNGGPYEGSMGTCTDNLGQNWVYTSFPLLMPPAGATVAGITSITCQTAFPNVPPSSGNDWGVLILHFYEVTGARAGDTVAGANLGCSVVPARNKVTILVDYTGLVDASYSSDPVFGDFGMLGANNRGFLAMYSDYPGYSSSNYLILTSIYSAVGDVATSAPISFPYATQCFTVTIPQAVPMTDSGVNLGACDDECEKIAGQPINLTNGNVFIQQRDYVVPGVGRGIALERTWNSLWPLSPHANVPLTRMFGHSWTSTYEERVVPVDGINIVDYWRADGSKMRFTFSGWIILGSYLYNQTYPRGNSFYFYYDSNTGQYEAYDTGDHGRRYFSSTGALLSHVDVHGSTTTLTYDGQQRLTQVTAPGSRFLTFSYGDPANPNQATSVQDPTGVVANYEYDSSGRLTKVTYADDSFNSFNYDADSLILSVTDTEGKLLEGHTYDSYRRGLTSERADGVEKVTVTYDASGALASLTDSLGHITQYPSTTINERNVVTSVSGPGCASCGGRGNQTFVYDSLGRRTYSTDALGDVTHFGYDDYGDIYSRSDTVNGTAITWNYTYYSRGVVASVTDPLGYTTNYDHDSNGNLLSITTPPPGGRTPASVTSFAYDGMGQMLSITDPLSQTTFLTYSPAGLVESARDAQGKVTRFEYDGRGNRTATIDALNQRTTFEYDLGNRVKTITYPTTPPTSTSFTYDSRGRRTSVTDANNNTTTYGYDDADRLISITDPQHGITQYAYDTESHLISITDALLRVTQYEYDDNGRVWKTIFPSGLFETYSYDAVGNLIGKTDRKNQTISYTYDALRRLERKQYPDGTQVNYTYDLASRLTQVSDPTGTYGYTYDNMGRLTQVSTTYSFIPNKTFTVAYGWDAASNLVSMTDPQRGTTTYTYDTLNRLSTLKDPQRNQFGFAYDALARRTQVTRPNNVATNYLFDELSRPTSILHQFTSSKGVVTTIDGVGYSYDAVGNRLSRTDKRTNVISSFGYDPLYELTSVTQGATTVESYSYDAVGNRLSSLAVPTYTYDWSNHLTSQPGVTYAYDDNGNLISKTDASGTTTYTWDFDNHLTRVTLPGGSQINFKYDPMGRRIQKSSSSGTVNYVYDGANVLEEVDNAGTVVARYTQGGVDEPLAGLRSGTTSFYQADALGSVTSLSNSSGAVANTYTYDSFGRLTGSTGSVTNAYRYTGREFDVESGLYYNRARYYDPQVGRFISEDPIIFSGGSNFYRYVNNSPVIGRDPSGLWSPGAHDALISHALGCGAPDFVVNEIQQDSREWDSMAQAPDQSNFHSMAMPGQTAQQAVDARNQIIADYLNRAQFMYQHGRTKNAYWDFAVAIHVIMDMTSPAHTDGNGNPYTWYGVTDPRSQAWKHSPNDLTGIERVKDLTDAIYALNDDGIRTAYQYMTGKALCGCN